MIDNQYVTLGLLASKDDLPLISVTTHDVKIAVFGESGCGKSELISRITKVNGNHGDETRGIVVSSLYYPIRVRACMVMVVTMIAQDNQEVRAVSLQYI